jgi:hypothetical protein
MDINKIFSLFSSSQEKSPSTESIPPITIDENVLIEYRIKMYDKIINNFNTSGREFLKNLETHPDFNIEDIEQAGRYIAYNSAWYHISELNISDNTHCNILIKCNCKSLKKNLILGIKYFEDREEYLKCAHLKKILDKL